MPSCRRSRPRRASRRTPSSRIASRRSSAQVSAYGTFQSALETLQAALTHAPDLEQPRRQRRDRGRRHGGDRDRERGRRARHLFARRAEPRDCGELVDRRPMPAPHSTVGTGTLTLSLGGVSTNIAIDSSDNTVAGIAAAINGAPNNPGVTASVLTTSAGSRLILSGTQTGATNAINVTESGGDGGLSALVYDPADNAAPRSRRPRPRRTRTSPSTASPRPAPAIR